MEIITSKQNSVIKKVRSLQDKKFREQLGFFICEGIKMVKEAISYGNISDIIFTKKHEKDFKGILVSEEVFKYISTQNTPDGIMAVVKITNNKIPDILKNFLILDGISDPANIGAILRTASAFGYNDILLLNDCCDIYNPKVVSASRGGIFKVKCYEADVNILAELKKQNKNIILLAADMLGKSLSEYKKEDSQIYGLVLGNEANGISKEILQYCDDTISIPMESGTESLNVSVSAGIIMNHLR